MPPVLFGSVSTVAVLVTLPLAGIVVTRTGTVIVAEACRLLASGPSLQVITWPVARAGAAA